MMIHWRELALLFIAVVQTSLLWRSRSRRNLKVCCWVVRAKTGAVQHITYRIVNLGNVAERIRDAGFVLSDGQLQHKTRDLPLDLPPCKDYTRKFSPDELDVGAIHCGYAARADGRRTESASICYREVGTD